MPIDNLQTFLFENTDIRGALVTLDASFSELLQGKSYNSAEQQLLASFIAANVLITSHLKFEGSVSLQVSAKGALSLVMSECNDALQYRAIIENDSPLESLDFAEIFAEAALAITVEPKQGQRYQGIVSLEGEDLAACLQQYFEQSEQLPTWFKFTCSNGQVKGLMLQALPAQICVDKERRDEDWRRIRHLASTLSQTEMLELDNETLLHRLYHEEPLRLFDTQAVSYHCACSAERMERALLSMGEAQLREIIAEDGDIKTQCHFCHTDYHFSEADIQQLLLGAASGNAH